MTNGRRGGRHLRVVVLLKTSVGGLWSVPLAAELRTRGHDVVFVLPSVDGRLPDAVRLAGMEVVASAAPLQGRDVFRRPLSVLRLRRQISGELRADVVVSHLFASALAGRAATARSPVPHIFMSAGPLYLENRAIALAERVLCRLDAHVICSSGALLTWYLRLGMPDDRLSMVPYTVDPSWSGSGGPDARRQARLELALADDEFVVCCVAYFYAPKRLVHRGRGIKGHDTLLEAWALHRQRGGRGTLLLVGGGFGPEGVAHRAGLRARFRDTEGVRWIDHVADVTIYYRASDVSVSPSLSENYGAPSEASTLGIPSVASDVGGLPELVIDGTTGWLVPPSDPLQLANALREVEVAGDAERQRRGALARQRAGELFDRERNADAFADIVERVARR